MRHVNGIYHLDPLKSWAETTKYLLQHSSPVTLAGTLPAKLASWPHPRSLTFPKAHVAAPYNINMLCVASESFQPRTCYDLCLLVCIRTGPPGQTSPGG